MKNIFIYAIIAVGFAFLLSACEKQNTPKMDQNPVSANDKKVEQQIKDFLKKLKNPQKTMKQ